MYIFPFTYKNNNETERQARNKQFTCGHIGNEQGFESWLAAEYTEHSLSRRRQTWLAHKYLETDKVLDVLEIGSATGDLTIFFSTLFSRHSYTIHDVSAESLNRFFPISRSFFKVNAEFQQVVFFAEEIPLPDCSFDVIFIKAAVHHFENPKKAFTEIRRILKPKGKVIFINDGVSLPIPIVGFLQEIFFARAEKAQGFNEHLYSLKTYMSFGAGFSKKHWSFDPLYEDQIRMHAHSRGILKSSVWKIAEKNRWLYRMLFTYRFPSAFIFEFTK